ncbi:hypothetical protein G4L39_08610 [Limisphaera ngatamarikiensis]|uniref:Dynamin N-terminal domain-containing protein n=1 Tax=Limisphaera ngatamarikiensis TaxID=1324935 RepID=A0A6M1RS56_9BACT|nr:dynamin family protein [Limisphaera ngatamarikiensis]NGO39455.1 hypothetical protein [Limisphaera ngatamarikiensis]
MDHAAEVLDGLTRVVGELRLQSLEPQLAACRDRLRAGTRVEVAVLGRFKAGKSSFLNHLAGRAVLPIGVIPLTAVITRLRHGPRERVRVHFLDGSFRDIPPEQIRHYVAEDENPHNLKQVASVELELPELKPLAPLEFVDTPGLGSALTHNTEVALNWLPNVGAALVAVSADAPLGEPDLNLLDQLRRHTPTIALLLTKADLLTEAQRAEVQAFVTTQLRQRWDGGLPVFFYSIKPELAWPRSVLVAEFLEPLRQNRHQAGTAILRHKLASLRHQALNSLQLALAAATQVESARAALREKLADERRQFELLRTELALFAREQSARALDTYQTALRPAQAALQAKVTTAFQTQPELGRLRPPRLFDAWRTWLQDWLRRELTELSHSRQEMFLAPLHHTRAHLTRTLQAFHDRLAAHVKAALGVTLAQREFVLEVYEPRAPPVDVAFAFDPAFTSISWLIPMTLFRRAIQRSLLRKARYEVEKNLSQLAAEWRERVAVAIEDLRRQAESEARNELEELERMLQQSPSDAARLRERISELESLPIP